ncbi:MAG: CDP-glycerol glycerophosphotransferase family protein [Lachnospiraceae bacterium]|nr:CDP-glycerol glycerophosphotransferase family protein [Lachnospiraceae bacterium]
MNHSFFAKLKEISYKDILQVFVFLLALIPALVYKKMRPHLWLVCEHKNEAADNGYWFFRYLREVHPEVDSVYAINSRCRDYKKVKNLGPTISFGTFKHWIYYLAAEVNISSQKGGKPNAAVCYFLEVYGILKNKRVFLQHGITKDNVKFLHYKNAKFAMIVTNTEREHEYMKANFGYKNDELQMTGMPRFDNLYRNIKQATKNIRKILIMPTWRSWINPPSNGKAEIAEKDIKKSTYYKAWNGLINDKTFIKLIEDNDLQVVFYQHREMQKFEGLFASDNPRITVVDPKKTEVQQLLIDSDFMITDYSSVAMDFAYMDKPLCYFQFDYEEFRSKHYEEGYFSYVNDGFGPVCRTKEEVINTLTDFVVKNQDKPVTVMENATKEAVENTTEETVTQEKSAASVKDKYAEYARRREEFFTLKDDKNCERTFEAIKSIIQR